MAKNRKPDRKNVTRLIALVLCILLAGTAVVGTLISIAYAEESSEPGTHLTLTVAEGAQGLRALQITTYVNNTGKALEQVMFSLNANCLRRPSTAPFENAAFDAAYPDGFEAGGVLIERVTVDGMAANWGVQGEGENFVRVDCALDAGASAQFAFTYQVLLPRAQGFLGTGEIGWRLSFFMPAPCVYDAQSGQFAMIEMRAVGECAYFETQDFTVVLDAPDTYWVASGGSQVRQAGETGRARTTIRLSDASSFALAISRRYSLYQDAAHGVRIDCYANTASGANRALAAAKKIVAVYSENLGGCPFEAIAIAQADQIDAVAAHDGLLLVDKALFGAGRAGELEQALAYGLAKQWFGLAVRTSPEKAPWLSDALCLYLSLLYYERAYGHERFLAELNARLSDALNLTLPGGLTPDASRSQFSSQSTYDIIVKRRGAAVLHEMRQLTGEKTMWEALGLYYRDNRGRTAEKEQLAQAISQADGRDLAKALDNYLLTISEMANQRAEWLE